MLWYFSLSTSILRNNNNNNNKQRSVLFCLIYSNSFALVCFISIIGVVLLFTTDESKRCKITMKSKYVKILI